METPSHKAPKWFTVVAILALVWNLLGVLAYIMQVSMTPEMVAQIPPEQRALYEATPAWATGAFAVAVFAGALGSLLLVMKRGLATAFLVLSLLAVLVQNVWGILLSDNLAVLGAASLVMPIVVIVIAVSLVFLSRSAKAKGWLK
jgi:hypothetical protein